jgi:N-acyl-D-amino-acid deacylase
MWKRPPGAAGFDDGQPKPVYYGLGWNVRPVGDRGRANTWHSGLISGTSTILVRRHDGLNWAVLFNTDRNPGGKVLSGIIDPLVHQAADEVKEWPTADQFGKYLGTKPGR